MRELAERKRRPLYLVGASPPHPSSDVGDYSSIFLDRSFQIWQRALAAVKKNTEVAEETLQSRTAQHSAPHAVTTEEFIQVMLATIREGSGRPRWPLEAVTKFLAADIILPAKPIDGSQ